MNKIILVTRKEIVTVRYEHEDGFNDVRTRELSSCDYTESVNEAVADGVLSPLLDDIANWVKEKE